MAKLWETPIYRFNSILKKEILIDVTTSVSPGIPPNKVVTERLIPLFVKRKVHKILDFGAGALRHCFPLLDAGFEVCAVEFKEGFTRPACQKALEEASKHAGFSALIWPKDFINDRRKFDAALLFYVVQVMPLDKERQLVLKQIYRKLRDDAYLVYAARYGQITKEDTKHKVSDGYYKWPDRKQHSFYREFTTETTHTLMNAHGFTRIRSLGERGSDQIFVYVKGKATWI
jgi:SAM-dependent methyltransferase